jgi:hypothetical protein
VRHLVVFFVLGGILFAITRGIDEREVRERPRLVVNVGRDVPAADVERAIDQAVLFHEALARGAALADPVVRAQLATHMGLTPDTDPGTRELELARALDLGVARADPSIRERLAFQAFQVLRAEARLDEPSDETLAAYVEAHRARYLAKERLDLTHVFASRERHGPMLERHAEGLAARLAAGLSEGDAHRVSDPSILPLSYREITSAELDNRFGPGFAAAVSKVPLRTWSTPIASSYGLHFVWVSRRVPQRMPELSTLRARVRADYLEDQRNRSARQALAQLRQHYEIELVRGAP